MLYPPTHGSPTLTSHKTIPDTHASQRTPTPSEMATSFKDLLKSSKDLLSKPYSYSNKAEVKTSVGGVDYTAEAVVSKPGE